MTQLSNPNEVQELSEYLEARQRYDALVAQYPDFMRDLQQLAQEVNTKRQAADKVMRAREFFYGPWIHHSTQTRYDADALADALGPEEFAACGGVETTKVLRNVDKTKVEMAIATGRIPKEVVDQVKTVKPTYKSPNDLSF